MAKNESIPKLNKPLDNRIVGHEMVAVDQLLANPRNWRLHPRNQQEALAGSIDDVGFIRSITVNKVSGAVVDGHARVTLAARSGVEALPVEWVELSEADEAKALALLDPISAMAEADTTKLDELLRIVNSDDARVQEALAEIAAKNDVINDTLARDGFDFGNLPQEDRAPFQQMTFTLHDTQAEQVKDAMKAAKDMGAFVDSPNENSNGNALARICETFLTEHGNG